MDTNWDKFKTSSIWGCFFYICQMLCQKYGWQQDVDSYISIDLFVPWKKDIIGWLLGMELYNLHQIK